MFSKFAAAAVFTFSAMSASAAVITLQPGAEGKDAHISAGWAADLPQGNDQHFTKNFSGVEDKFGMIEFDLSAYAGQNVVSATLRLYADWNLGGGQQYSIAQNKGAWDEATVTYNNAPGVESEPMDSIVTVSNQHWYSFDVTSAVGDWLSGGSPNFGFRVMETNGIVYFASSDHGTAAFRPILEIVTADAAIPEPSSLLLLAGGLFGFALSRRRKH